MLKFGKFERKALLCLAGTENDYAMLGSNIQSVNFEALRPWPRNGFLCVNAQGPRRGASQPCLPSCWSNRRDAEGPGLRRDSI